MSKQITYTFPLDFKLAELRGVTATGGEFCRADGKWQQQVDAVRFAAPKVDGGKNLITMVAGKPELEALLAVHLAELAAAKQHKAEADAAYALTPRGQYSSLHTAWYNLYNPEDFPGSKRWMACNKARNALQAFEAAYPELMSELETEHKASEKARYDALSDFVKNGS